MHEYMKRLAAAHKAGKIPSGVANAAIAHDPLCGVFYGRECDCNPTITVRSQTSGKAHEDN